MCERLPVLLYRGSGSLCAVDQIRKGQSALFSGKACAFESPYKQDSSSFRVRKR